CARGDYGSCSPLLSMDYW
nr:immunoglobulin heavy chain junction region [Mus musculus]